MVPVTVLPPRADGWSVDDLHALPDDGNRYELLDGRLLVSPPPELSHQHLVSGLVSVLRQQLPQGLTAVAAPGLYYDPRNYRVPDVAVFPRAVLERPRPRLAPPDVLLAVELVSPGSARVDRVLKPAEYAAAGIASFWRWETEDGVLVVHDLRGEGDGAGYREVARFDDVVEVERPAPLRFRVADLLR